MSLHDRLEEALLSDKTDDFPGLTLPQPLLDEVDAFAANFSSASTAEREREQTRVRDSLLGLWAKVQQKVASPGNTTALEVSRVSSFVTLLSKMSVSMGQDDAYAVVRRSDVRTVWWPVLLSRVLLVPRTRASATDATPAVPAARPAARRRGGGHKRTPSELSVDQLLAQPAHTYKVSRAGLDQTMKIAVWTMSSYTLESEDGAGLSEFAQTVFEEYALRAGDRFYAHDKKEEESVNLLEECLIGWGESFPKPFFTHIAPYISIREPTHLSFLALALAFLSRYSGKTYHCMETPLCDNIVHLALSATDIPTITLAVKALIVLLVSLPVVLGVKTIIACMVVCSRLILWEDTVSSTTTPPDARPLFTVLYGLYPINFLRFLAEPNSYITAREWSFPPDVLFYINPEALREQSTPLMQQHTLSSALLTGEYESELKDTERWRKLESADVMAECDMNVLANTGISGESYASHLVTGPQATSGSEQRPTSTVDSLNSGFASTWGNLQGPIPQLYSQPTLPPATDDLIGQMQGEITLLRGEVNYQFYLKNLHVAHMGTLHRQKVLRSGAEAERQGLSRLIRTLRAQLQHSKESLEKFRTETSVSKANWNSHLEDMREKLKTLREQKVKWDADQRTMEAEIVELKEQLMSQAQSLEEQTALVYDLRNERKVSQAQFDRIDQYEKRIEVLSEALSVSNRDVSKYDEQREETDQVVAAWYQSDMRGKALEKELNMLRKNLADAENENWRLVKQIDSMTTQAELRPTVMKRDPTERLHKEISRLRRKNVELQIKLLGEEGMESVDEEI